MEDTTVLVLLLFALLKTFSSHLKIKIKLHYYIITKKYCTDINNNTIVHPPIHCLPLIHGWVAGAAA